jgi:hypothetical protein
MHVLRKLKQNPLTSRTEHIECETRTARTARVKQTLALARENIECCLRTRVATLARRTVHTDSVLRSSFRSVWETTR